MWFTSQSTVDKRTELLTQPLLALSKPRRRSGSACLRGRITIWPTRGATTMKNTLALWVAATVLAMAGSTAHAAIVTIDDLLDGPPAAQTDLALATITATFQQVIIGGQINPLNQPTGFSAPGTRSVIFVEPAVDPFGPRVSDYI